MEKITAPMRFIAAICIFTGGAMHARGLMCGLESGYDFPLWAWAIFLIAMAGYTISAIGILKNIAPAFYFAALAPMVGGSLIFLGFIFPDSRLIILIPGTFENEITLTGFITLLVEPMAVVLSILCLAMTKVLNNNCPQI